MVTGNNGILTQTQNAKEANRAGTVQEIVDLWKMEKLANETLGTTARELDEVLDELVKEGLLTTNERIVIEENGEVKIGGETIKFGTTTTTTTTSIASMYEDCAGDEDGATAGKIHIGDYVNYNPNPNNYTTEQMTEENGYKYISSNEDTGITEAKDDSNYASALADVENQTFTVDSNLKWRVLGIDGDYLLIIPESPIIPDTAITYGDNSGYFMYGAYAYENCITELDNISKIYANGNGALKARGLTIEDVNKITGLTASDTELSPTVNNIWYDEGEFNAYGSEIIGITGWTPSAWINESNRTSRPTTNILGNVEGYAYYGNETNLETANTDSIKYNLIFGSRSELKIYWLASRGLGASSSNACFGPGNVGVWLAGSYGEVMDPWAENGGFASSCTDCFYESGYSNGFSIGVYPVVYLNSDTKLTVVSTDNGITTWDIE